MFKYRIYSKTHGHPVSALHHCSKDIKEAPNFSNNRPTWHYSEQFINEFRLYDNCPKIFLNYFFYLFQFEHKS